MDIGSRLREVREFKKLSQGDIEKRTGLLRCYLSRVENGHTVPALETLEKMARALEVQMYELFYDLGESSPLSEKIIVPRPGWGANGKSARYVTKLRRSLVKMSESDRDLLVHFAKAMVKNHNGRPAKSTK
jgi:transcriptional regulator with XRE-family HTH domain